MPKYKVKAGHFSRAGHVGPAPDYLWIPGESYGPGATVELTVDEAKGLGLHRFESTADYKMVDVKPNPSNDDWEKAEFDNGGLVPVEPSRDGSIGDVIVADPDSTIVLDDGVTTWNDERAAEFLAQKEEEKVAVSPAIMPGNSWSSVVSMNGPDVGAIVDATQDSTTLDAIETAEKSGRNRVGVLDRVRVKRARMGWS